MRLTLHHPLRKDLLFKPYPARFTNELLDIDFERQYKACRALLDNFPDDESRSKVLFSDECAICRSSRNQNVMWAKENQNFFFGIGASSATRYDVRRCDINCFDRSLFLKAPVNAKTYFKMLEDYLIPELRGRGLLNDMWLQRDGAPAHFALCVPNILNKHFLGRWIGHSSSASPAPLAWPPRSPDLTTPDNALWGIIKDQVSARRYYSNNDLRRAVENAFATITPELLKRMYDKTWRRIQLCFENNGEHTDILDV